MYRKVIPKAKALSNPFKGCSPDGAETKKRGQSTSIVENAAEDVCETWSSGGWSSRLPILRPCVHVKPLECLIGLRVSQRHNTGCA